MKYTRSVPAAVLAVLVTAACDTSELVNPEVDGPTPNLSAAPQAQIRTQFLSESVLPAFMGGGVGVLAGALATAVYASSNGWAVVIPVEAWLGGITSAILIGAVAGLMPAVRASRLPPSVALRTV